ncbi:aminoglycoside phosphotransferase family protein [Bacillus salitolerans]|uniref:Aminoglycoside phosphotransferase family protein n=1 Tax=Bacillus salitolerans TaxID=1437434 RepID=A0ABW4LWD3_9BACI
MEITQIIDYLIHHYKIGTISNFQPLIGGTVSELYLLTTYHNDRYVVKMNHPEVIKTEDRFLTCYKDLSLLPSHFYTDSNYRYIVYSYIEGSTNYPHRNKQEMLKIVVEELINQYEVVHDAKGWGFADEVSESWQSFLMSRVQEASTLVNSYLEQNDYTLVQHLVQTSELNQETVPYLLHGDCGVHNFIFLDGKISGVIDPTAVYGHPLYDLVYAFFSSPDELTKEAFDFAFGHFKFKDNANSNNYGEVLIGLYLRLSTCIKHHPHDLENYLKAWNYWIEIFRNDK